jgi:hypothetical protein
MRAGSDQRHIALDDIDKLRNFIETGFAEYFPDWRNPGIAQHRLFHAARVANVAAHRPEFINFEVPISIPVSVLKKKHRTRRCDLDRDRHRDQQRREQQKRGTCRDDVEYPLSHGCGRLAAHRAPPAPASVGAIRTGAGIFDWPHRYEGPFLEGPFFPERAYIALIKAGWDDGGQLLLLSAGTGECHKTLLNTLRSQLSHRRSRTAVEIPAIA